LPSVTVLPGIFKLDSTGGAKKEKEKDKADNVIMKYIIYNKLN